MDNKALDRILHVQIQKKTWSMNFALGNCAGNSLVMTDLFYLNCPGFLVLSQVDV